ncbi:MAG: hypothetical protein JJ863_35250 [Deltaproteobacteria bacterium]|nr:hypothetical protein [Deltaproteobacteria bacterium]
MEVGGVTMPVVAKSEIELRSEGGGHVTIRGYSHARVTVDGDTHEYRAPVVSAVRGDTLAIERENGADVFPLEDVERVEVSQYASGKAAAVVVGILVLVGAIAGGVYLAVRE